MTGAGGIGWTVHGDGKRIADGAVVAPDERLSWPRTIGIGMQHVIAMFGATLLVPTITGFPVTTTLLFSGIGTALFLLITRGRIPSYLGSSFAFIAPLTASAGSGPAAQLGAVMAVGIVLMLIGVAVRLIGSRVIDAVMPPVVTGAVVALIGLNLAPTAVGSFESQPLIATVTLVSILLVTVVGPGLLGRLGILVGVVIGWVFAAVIGGLDSERVSALREADWFGLPSLHGPSFDWSVIVLALPVVIVLVAENVGHVKAVSAMTGKSLDDLAGNALFADGLATTLAGAGGGSGTTTYAENIGVMAATRVYSTAAYWVAAATAVILAFSPKFGALVFTVPNGVIGGATMVLYGLIGILGVRIWMEAKVDFTDPVNLTVAAAALVAGIGNLTLTIGSVELGGIAWGSIGILVAYPIMRYLAKFRTSSNR
ncbi:uracil-xanthine permease family protein [Rhodococcus erythropolis]|jgi:uracil-xanthine permease|nr:MULTISPECIES: solute carrier family 23 protein [Rhodococcus]MCD2157397.1 nitrate reductase [Rhodococcus cerastii]NHE63479.1 nitrate reductase [Rhodococcus sp. D-46]AGT92412.1 uracil permease [Rhodococcus erythropolis CCM2595]AKE00658.1 nitrate reductase [Rhodococcus erythropolis]ALU71272.1 nitrate reductase [Rhodococcus erythropolis R138]